MIGTRKAEIIKVTEVNENLASMNPAAKRFGELRGNAADKFQ